MKYRHSTMEILVGVTAGMLIGACTLWLVMQDGYADDYIDASLGVFGNGRPSPANVKYAEIGHLDPIGLGFFNQYSGGGWIQVQEGDGRKSSGFVSDQFGLQVENGIVARIATGPSLISTPDSYLGGHFQFHETIFLGIRDNGNGNQIGFAYQHFSSAGLEMPNMGRDFGGIELSFPF